MGDRGRRLWRGLAWAWIALDAGLALLYVALFVRYAPRCGSCRLVDPSSYGPGLASGLLFWASWAVPVMILVWGRPPDDSARNAAFALAVAGVFCITGMTGALALCINVAADPASPRPEVAVVLERFETMVGPPARVARRVKIWLRSEGRLLDVDVSGETWDQVGPGDTVIVRVRSGALGWTCVEGEARRR